MNAEITLRDEHEDDTDIVDVLVGEAFDGRHNEVALVRGLRSGGEPAISRVAVREGAIVGHAMVSLLGLEGSDILVLGLAPVSVVPLCQGTGIGTCLVQDAVALAGQCQAALLIVLGDPRYYGRFGFEPASQYGIEPPPGVPPRGLMAKGLSPLPRAPRGRVVYPPLFADTGTL